MQIAQEPDTAAFNGVPTMCLKYTCAILIVIFSSTHVCSREPNNSQIDWVKRTAIPFKTVVAGNGFEDRAHGPALADHHRCCLIGVEPLRRTG